MAAKFTYFILLILRQDFIIFARLTSNSQVQLVNRQGLHALTMTPGMNETFKGAAKWIEEYDLQTGLWGGSKPILPPLVAARILIFTSAVVRLLILKASNVQFPKKKKSKNATQGTLCLLRFSLLACFCLRFENFLYSCVCACLSYVCMYVAQIPGTNFCLSCFLQL